MIKESNILYDNDVAYVTRVAYGHYEVWKNTNTHSVSVGTVHYTNNDSLAYAKAIRRADEEYGKAKT